MQQATDQNLPRASALGCLARCELMTPQRLGGLTRRSALPSPKRLEHGVRGRRAVTLLGHHRSAVRVHCSEPTAAYQSLTLTAKPSTAARSWWRILNWTANRHESACVPVSRFESYPHPRPALFRHRWQSMRRHGGKVRKLSAGLVQRSGRHRCLIQPTTVRLTHRYERTFVRRGRVVGVQA
jgi:hypothetical protein